MILWNPRRFGRTSRLHAVSVLACFCALSSAVGCNGGKATGASMPAPADSKPSLAASSAIAQAPKAPARSEINNADMESMIRAHVLVRFGNKDVKPELLGIATVNGIAFRSLPNTFAVPNINDLVVEDGYIKPKVGGKVIITFPGSGIVVSGIGDGEEGIKIIQSLRIAEGTHVQLKDGGLFVFKGGRWRTE